MSTCKQGQGDRESQVSLRRLLDIRHKDPGVPGEYKYGWKASIEGRFSLCKRKLWPAGLYLGLVMLCPLALQAQSGPEALGGKTLETPASPAAQSGVCFEIDNIDLSGLTLVSDVEQEEVLAPFVNRCLGLEDINLAMEAVTLKLIEHGWIAARVYLPEQDLSDRSLELVILEGKVEEIRMEGSRSPHRLRRQARMAFPGLVGKPLNLRDLEQGLAQMNRLDSVEAKAALSAGLEEGGTVLDVSRTQRHQVQGYASIDNAGVDTTGEFQTSVGLTLDDPLGLNDKITLSMQGSNSNMPLDLGTEFPSGWSASFAYELIYGDWTMRVDTSRSGYQSIMAGTAGDIETSGGSAQLALGLTKLLSRSASSSTTLDGSITRTANESAILGTRIEASSYTVTSGRIALGHKVASERAESSVTISLERGLSLWGATTRIDPSGPDPRYLAARLEASYRRSFGAELRSVTYDGRLVLHWSDDVLLGAQQVGLGGPSTVRGERGSILFGNRGLFIRNELAFPSRAQWGVDQALPWIGLDAGWIDDQPMDNVSGGAIVGAVIGLKGSKQNLRFDLSYARFIAVPDEVAIVAGHGGVFRASVSVAF